MFIHYAQGVLPLRLTYLASTALFSSASAVLDLLLQLLFVRRIPPRRIAPLLHPCEAFASSAQLSVSVLIQYVYCYISQIER